MEDNKVDGYFGSIGFDFPSNQRQLENFNKLYADYKFQGNEHVIDPVEILHSCKPVSNIDYHKRTVLAAEIIFQLQSEPTLGHLKVQKLMYLCQNSNNMSLRINFLKQAMGPHDPQLMRSIDSQLLKRGWFRYEQNSFLKYIPLPNAGKHKMWFDRYFDKEAVEINKLIDVFRRSKGDKIELVATIFACLLDSKKRRQIISDKLIIQKVYDWSDHKLKFPEERIVRALHWMKEFGLYPDN